MGVQLVERKKYHESIADVAASGSFPALAVVEVGVEEVQE